MNWLWLAHLTILPTESEYIEAMLDSKMTLGWEIDLINQQIDLTLTVKST